MLHCDGAGAAATEAEVSSAAAAAAAALVDGREKIVVGDTVLITGLESRPELNGCFGTVIRRAANTAAVENDMIRQPLRWGVRLRADLAALATGRKVKLLSLADGTRDDSY